jgi:ABC-type transport system involved in cytochrome c biogenesis permease component
VTAGGLALAHRDLDHHTSAPAQATRDLLRSHFVAAAVPVSYGPDRNDMYRRAPGYVDLIRNGSKCRLVVGPIVVAGQP